MSEKLCLKWNDFQENVNSAFGNLREDSEFADVTLACEDGQQIEAHKMILAASSPFFKNLLKRNKHPHPLIFMRELKVCKICGKEGQATAMKDHIEANHLEGVSLPCNVCEKAFRSRQYLRRHICRKDTRNCQEKVKKKSFKT